MDQSHGYGDTMKTMSFKDAPLEVRKTLKEGSKFAYTIGAFLGFPQCCTTQFLKSSVSELKAQHQKLIDHPLNGTGYVPCDHCITLNPIELIATINANRTFIHPFPFKGGILDTAGSHFEDFKRKYEASLQ